jgi:hypothetical protein
LLEAASIPSDQSIWLCTCFFPPISSVNLGIFFDQLYSKCFKVGSVLGHFTVNNMPDCFLSTSQDSH